MKRLTRMQTIRKYCVWCFNNQPRMIKECPSVECVLYSRRGGYEDKSIELDRRLTARQAIMARCRGCGTGTHTDVRLCKITDCLLWMWRLGKNPYPSEHKGNIANLHKHRQEAV